MSKFCYLIRQNNFAYNDEYFLTDAENPPVLGKIESFYTNKEQATQHWKVRIVEALRHEPIDLFTGEDDMSLEKIQTIRHELQNQYGIYESKYNQ